MIIKSNNFFSDGTKLSQESVGCSYYLNTMFLEEKHRTYSICIFAYISAIFWYDL